MADQLTNLARITGSKIGSLPGLLAVSFVLGYFLGANGSQNARHKSLTSYPRTDLDDEENEEEEGEEDEEDDDNDGTDDDDRPSDRPARENHKLVLCVRQDLGMSKGKAAAQCSHATLACYKSARKKKTDSLLQWEHCGQPKVTLKINSDEEMDDLYTQAVRLGLVAYIIHDAGRTQIAPGSRTVLGIGPGPDRLVDMVTRHLKLY